MPFILLLVFYLGE